MSNTNFMTVEYLTYPGESVNIKLNAVWSCITIILLWHYNFYIYPCKGIIQIK